MVPRPGLMLAPLAGCSFVATAGDNTVPAADAGPDATADARPFELTDCPATYRVVSGAPSRYRVGTGRPYPMAHAECKNDSAGFTHLVVVDTVMEGAALRSAAGSLEYWTGTVQRPNQATPTAGWFVITGGAVANVWASSQPNESGNPEQNEQNVAKHASGGLDDDRYTDAHVVVCECDGKPVDPVIEGYLQQ